jgi:hypothetical protein
MVVSGFSVAGPRALAQAGMTCAKFITLLQGKVEATGSLSKATSERRRTVMS